MSTKSNDRCGTLAIYLTDAEAHGLEKLAKKRGFIAPNGKGSVKALSLALIDARLKDSSEPLTYPKATKRPGTRLFKLAYGNEGKTPTRAQIPKSDYFNGQPTFTVWIQTLLVRALEKEEEDAKKVLRPIRPTPGSGTKEIRVSMPLVTREKFLAAVEAGQRFSPGTTPQSKINWAIPRLLNWWRGLTEEGKRVITASGGRDGSGGSKGPYVQLRALVETSVYAEMCSQSAHWLASTPGFYGNFLRRLIDRVAETGNLEPTPQETSEKESDSEVWAKRAAAFPMEAGEDGDTRVQQTWQKLNSTVDAVLKEEGMPANKPPPQLEVSEAGVKPALKADTLTIVHAYTGEVLEKREFSSNKLLELLRTEALSGYGRLVSIEPAVDSEGCICKAMPAVILTGKTMWEGDVLKFV